MGQKDNNASYSLRMYEVRPSFLNFFPCDLLLSNENILHDCALSAP